MSDVETPTRRDPLFTGKARPHYFLPGTVFDAALRRIRWLFDEFDGHVSVSTSGGKDSTVVTELALIVARERGALPLKVHFLDQEAEYQSTRDYLRRLADRDEIAMDWYQIPFRLFNATSHHEQWTHVWDENLDDTTWLRPKEPDSIKENPFFKGRGKKRHQVDRFKEVLHAMNERDGGAILTGMRCEESPTRRVFMTSVPSYKWATWCSGGTKGNRNDPTGPYLFHPIYDWSYRDIWKAINENDWDYNIYYDAMFQRGIPTRSMRVSSFHHEQSQNSLSTLQEIEPKTWERAVARFPGVNTYNKVGDDIYAMYRDPKLPYMFTTWTEYVDYLITHLVEGDENRRMFYKQWANAEHVLPWVPRREIVRAMYYQVMFNDAFGSGMNTWVSTQKSPAKKREWAQWRKEMAATEQWGAIEREEAGRGR